MECKICEKEMQNAKGLSYHVKTKHGIDYWKYLLEYENEKNNICQECNNEYVFDRKKHNSVTRYKQMSFCSVECQRKNKDYRYSIGSGFRGKIPHNKGVPHTNEHNEKLSKSVSKAYIKGFGFSRGLYTSVKTNKEYRYRSSWEKKYMEFLDNNKEVVYWEYEPFMIPYVFEGVNRNYLVDFMIYYSDGKKSLCEIGVDRYKTKQLRNLAKFKYAEDYCRENNFLFDVITENSFAFLV